MANLIELAEFTPGIYQLEEEDLVKGGADGIDNLQAKQLAARTAWLKQQIETLGNNKQAADPTLDAIAALVGAADRMLYFTGQDSAALTIFTAFARSLLDDADAAAMRVTLGLGAAALLAVGTAPGTVAAGDHGHVGFQPADVDLTAIAALASAANKMPYATGAGAWALADLTAFARTLLDDADAAAMRVTLGLGDLSTKSVATDFMSLLAGNGYAKFPGGLIIQWGTTASVAGNGGASGIITFPITFPNSADYVNFIGVGAVTSGSNTNLSLSSKTNSGFSFINAYLSADPFNWLAIGR